MKSGIALGNLMIELNIWSRNLRHVILDSDLTQNKDGSCVHEFLDLVKENLSPMSMFDAYYTKENIHKSMLEYLVNLL